MKQITIIAPRQDGLVARISSVLAQAGINIESLDASDVKDTDIVILTVDKYNEALSALRDADLPAITEDVFVVNIKDEPGALAKVTKRLFDGGIHLHSIRLLSRQFGLALVAVATDRNEEAMDLLKDVLVS